MYKIFYLIEYYVQGTKYCTKYYVIEHLYGEGGHQN